MEEIDLEAAGDVIEREELAREGIEAGAADGPEARGGSGGAGGVRCRVGDDDLPLKTKRRPRREARSPVEPD